MKHTSLALLLVLVGLTATSVYKANTIETILFAQQRLIPTLMSTTWTSAKGSHTLTTTRGEHDPDETPGEHATRHAAELAAMQGKFPPI